ncbi:MAG: helix-turn-helix domain-containing protein [Verrucomicrobiota bacterium]
MESIGQILKAARERRQISISDVAVATKMTSTFVQAIEADDFDALVAPIYARGFIKLYAECVGLDPMPLLKQFDVSSRAGPALAPPPSKAPPRKAPVAHAGKLKPKHTPIPSRPPSWSASLLAGRWPALNWTFISRVQWPRFKLPGRPACNAVRPPAVLRAAMWAGSTACPQSLRDSVAGAAGRVFRYFPLPVIVWRRIFIVAGVGLLIIAASLAWEWSHRGLPSTTDACQWLAEPPAPYLTIETHAPTPGH